MIDAFSLCRIIKLSFTPVDFLIVDSTNIAKELIHFQNVIDRAIKADFIEVRTLPYAETYTAFAAFGIGPEQARPYVELYTRLRQWYELERGLKDDIDRLRVECRELEADCDSELYCLDAHLKGKRDGPPPVQHQSITMQLENNTKYVVKAYSALEIQKTIQRHRHLHNIQEKLHQQMKRHKRLGVKVIRESLTYKNSTVGCSVMSPTHGPDSDNDENSEPGSPVRYIEIDTKYDLEKNLFGKIDKKDIEVLRYLRRMHKSNINFIKNPLKKKNLESRWVVDEFDDLVFSGYEQTWLKHRSVEEIEAAEREKLVDPNEAPPAIPFREDDETSDKDDDDQDKLDTAAAGPRFDVELVAARRRIELQIAKCDARHLSQLRGFGVESDPFAPEALDASKPAAVPPKAKGKRGRKKAGAVVQSGDSTTAAGDEQSSSQYSTIVQKPADARLEVTPPDQCDASSGASDDDSDEDDFATMFTDITPYSIQQDHECHLRTKLLTGLLTVDSDSEVTPSDTEVIPSDTEVIPSDTDVTPSDTEVAPSNTEVTLSTSSDVAAATETVSLSSKHRSSSSSHHKHHRSSSSKSSHSGHSSKHHSTSTSSSSSKAHPSSSSSSSKAHPSSTSSSKAHPTSTSSSKAHHSSSSSSKTHPTSSSSSKTHPTSSSSSSSKAHPTSSSAFSSSSSKTLPSSNSSSSSSKAHPTYTSSSSSKARSSSSSSSSSSSRRRSKHSEQSSNKESSPSKSANTPDKKKPDSRHSMPSPGGSTTKSPSAKPRSKSSDSGPFKIPKIPRLQTPVPGVTSTTTSTSSLNPPPIPSVTTTTTSFSSRVITAAEMSSVARKEASKLAVSRDLFDKKASNHSKDSYSKDSHTIPEQQQQQDESPKSREADMGFECNGLFSEELPEFLLSQEADDFSATKKAKISHREGLNTPLSVKPSVVSVSSKSDSHRSSSSHRRSGSSRNDSIGHSKSSSSHSKSSSSHSKSSSSHSKSSSSHSKSSSSRHSSSKDKNKDSSKSSGHSSDAKSGGHSSRSKSSGHSSRSKSSGHSSRVESSGHSSRPSSSGHSSHSKTSSTNESDKHRSSPSSRPSSKRSHSESRTSRSVDAKRHDSEKSEFKRNEQNKIDSVQKEKSESKKTDSKQSESKKTEPKRIESKKIDSEQSEKEKSESKKTDSKRSESKKIDPMQKEKSKKSDSKRSESKKIDSVQSEKSESKKTDSKQSESKKTEQKRIESKKIDAEQKEKSELKKIDSPQIKSKSYDSTHRDSSKHRSSKDSRKNTPEKAKCHVSLIDKHAEPTDAANTSQKEKPEAVDTTILIQDHEPAHDEDKSIADKKKVDELQESECENEASGIDEWLTSEDEDMMDCDSAREYSAIMNEIIRKQLSETGLCDPNQQESAVSKQFSLKLHRLGALTGGNIAYTDSNLNSCKFMFQRQKNLFQHFIEQRDVMGAMRNNLITNEELRLQAKFVPDPQFMDIALRLSTNARKRCIASTAELNVQMSVAMTDPICVGDTDMSFEDDLDRQLAKEAAMEAAKQAEKETQKETATAAAVKEAAAKQLTGDSSRTADETTPAVVAASSSKHPAEQKLTPAYGNSLTLKESHRVESKPSPRHDYTSTSVQSTSGRIDTLTDFKRIRDATFEASERRRECDLKRSILTDSEYRRVQSDRSKIDACETITDAAKKSLKQSILERQLPNPTVPFANVIATGIDEQPLNMDKGAAASKPSTKTEIIQSCNGKYFFVEYSDAVLDRFTYHDDNIRMTDSCRITYFPRCVETVRRISDHNSGVIDDMLSGETPALRTATCLWAAMNRHDRTSEVHTVIDVQRYDAPPLKKVTFSDMKLPPIPDHLLLPREEPVEFKKPWPLGKRPANPNRDLPRMKILYLVNATTMRRVKATIVKVEKSVRIHAYLTSHGIKRFTLSSTTDDEERVTGMTKLADELLATLEPLEQGIQRECIERRRLSREARALKNKKRIRIKRRGASGEQESELCEIMLVDNISSRVKHTYKHVKPTSTDDDSDAEKRDADDEEGESDSSYASSSDDDGETVKDVIYDERIRRAFADDATRTRPLKGAASTSSAHFVEDTRGFLGGLDYRGMETREFPDHVVHTIPMNFDLVKLIQRTPKPPPGDVL